MTCQMRLLERLIDHAAHIARAEILAGGAFDDLDALGVVDVTDVITEITQTVFVNITTRLLATDAELVAAHAAIAFTGRHGDAGHVCERLIECEDALLFDQLLGHDADRLRCFTHCGGHATDIERRSVGVHGVDRRRAAHLDRRQLHGRAFGRLRVSRSLFLRLGLFGAPQTDTRRQCQKKKTFLLSRHFTR